MRPNLPMLKLLLLLTIFSPTFCINAFSENKLNLEVEKKFERKVAQNIQEKDSRYTISIIENKNEDVSGIEKGIEKEKKENENNSFTLFALQQPPLEKNAKNKEIKNDVNKQRHFRGLQDSFISEEEIQNIEESLSDSSNNIKNPTSLCENDDFCANMFMDDYLVDFMDDDTERFYIDYSVVNNDIYNNYYSTLEDIGDYNNKVDYIKTVNLNIESNVENLYQENNEIDEKIEFGEIITENKMDTNCNTLNNALSDEKELDCKEFNESQIGTPNHDFLPFISGELHTRIFCFI